LDGFLLLQVEHFQGPVDETTAEEEEFEDADARAEDQGGAATGVGVGVVCRVEEDGAECLISRESSGCETRSREKSITG